MPDLLRSALRPLWNVRWPLLALALLLLVNAIFTPGFFQLDVRDGRLYGVLVDVLNHGSKVAIVALGMTLVIATGGVDLSVGAVAAIAGAVAAVLASHHNAPWPVAVAAALAAGALCGAWNASLVSFLRLQPIVATLILMVAGRGVAQLITGGLIVTFTTPGLVAIGNKSFLALPIPVTLLAIYFVLTALGTRRTPLGLFVESVGDNPAAARLAGVHDVGVRFAAYTLTGICAATAGLIEASYISAADANNAGQLLELDAILAVVIGGTALTGGRFSLLGTVVGAILMQALTKTLYMQNVPADIAPAPKALAVLVVCLLQSPRVRRAIATRPRTPTPAA